MRYAVPPPTALPTTSHAPAPPPTRPGGARHSVLTFAVAFRVSQGRTLAMHARRSGGMRVVPAAVRGGLCRALTRRVTRTTAQQQLLWARSTVVR